MAKQTRTTVAKIRIGIADGSGEILLSRKRSGNAEKHGRLEMPGGGADPQESHWDALLRELGEEETSGRLRALAAERLGPDDALAVRVGAQTHYLYQLDVDPDALARLRPDPAESLGFERAPAAWLVDPPPDAVTPKTLAILGAMREQGVRWRS